MKESCITQTFPNLAIECFTIDVPNNIQMEMLNHTGSAGSAVIGTVVVI